MRYNVKSITIIILSSSISDKKWEMKRKSAVNERENLNFRYIKVIYWFFTFHHDLNGLEPPPTTHHSFICINLVALIQGKHKSGKTDGGIS